MNDISEHKYLFHQGRDYRAYEFMGAHPEEDGTIFRVYAPRAEAASLVGDFNDWNADADPMARLEDDPTIWEIKKPDIKKWDLYKFAIKSDTGKTVLKADPYAFFSETGDFDAGSQRASKVYGLSDGYEWGDSEWLESRASRNPYRSAMNIYEMHLGSWMRKPDGSTHSYREIADLLIPYIKEMGYTHIELLPVSEYPYEGSWGYQCTGYYSPTARYGSPWDFKYLIDLAHKNGIGVIMDWVPAHFAKDEHGLIEFDGHPLYEDSDPMRMEHKGWGTRAFDFSRPEVISFLISNAFYYCDIFHIDGLRVDAVAAMLYLDYGRKDGEWAPNKNGGNENLEAISFLQNMNRDVLSNFPGVVTVAEESTAWPGITMPPEDSGLGFNFKWNMGWMNDELSYFATDPLFRKGHHGELVFSLSYAWSENYILPISHDEVVHGKKSLLDKMPGEYEDKFSTLRVFYAYMYAHPGKKLSFMGNEFGQFREWSEKDEIDWKLLEYDSHRRMKEFVQSLNRLYLETPELYALDDDSASFRWISGEDTDNNVISFIRYADADQKAPLVVSINLSGNDLTDYRIGVPDANEYIPLIDTDSRDFGGTGKRDKVRYDPANEEWNGYENSILIDLPRLSAIYLLGKQSHDA